MIENRKRIFLVFVILCLSWRHSFAQLSIAYDTRKESLTYAFNKIQMVLSTKDQLVEHFSIGEISKVPDISVVIKGNVPKALAVWVGPNDFLLIQQEGFAYRTINHGKGLLILSVDEIGGMYGLLELAEAAQLTGSYHMPQDKVVNPSLAYRIIKFNLPWSPYRKSPATAVHTQVCRDLNFWERFLDMMVENRFNVLSLWNNHPFPYMIRAKNFPKATPFNDREMLEWQAFWKELFRMAKVRGIQTFIVNWNIVVSPEFAKEYGAQEYNDVSPLVQRYTRECVTQMINEYEDLTGIGVTLADWMGTFDDKMTPQQREDWIEATFIEGMKDAIRPVKFIHRSVLAGDPLAMRRVIDKANLPDDVLVEIKFNWSHGHSTPKLAITHDYHSGKLDERFWSPPPTNYKIQWMIRNEDFFILRWGQPDFVRIHLEVNKKDYVNGYFIGSEGYIPAQDYFTRPSSTKTWQYAFEKQWLFYKVWGRLLYQQDTPDSYFSSVFGQRYGKGIGTSLLRAFKLASNMPLRLASFHRSTWDYTLYSEGFIEAEPSSPTAVFDRSSPFISIDEFINHETLDPAMQSIPEFIQSVLKNQPITFGTITPLALADSSEHDSREALALVESLRGYVTPYSGALVSELDDVATWSYLGLYFATKIRAGIALESFRISGDEDKKRDAIRHIKGCLDYWDQVVAFTKDRYMPTPHVSTQHYGKEFESFSWELLRPQVVRDIEVVEKATRNP